MKTTLPPFVMTALFASLFFTPLNSWAQMQETPTAFPDLEGADPSVEAIAWMKAQGMVEGYPDGTFKSLNKINRAEFMKIVVEAVEEDNAIQGSNCFPDVKEEWYAKYVCKGKEMGLVSGYPDGTFQPANNINFAEASKIITVSLGLEKAEATQEDPWYRPFVMPLSTEGAIPVSITDLDKPIARGEMAEIIWRVEENPENLDSLKYEELEAEPIKVESCDALKTLFLERHKFDDVYYYGDIMPLAFEESEGAMEDSVTAEAPTEAPQVKSEAPAQSPLTSTDYGLQTSPSYSETNVQVKGVDEADIVKTDGTYIYIVNSEKLRIVKAYPETEMQQIAEIEIEGNEEFTFSPSEVYVDSNTLTIIGNAYNYRLYGEKIWFPGFHQSRTGVFLYDISNPASPSLKRHMEFDGDYSESRKVDGTLYLVMNKFDFNYYNFDAKNADTAAIQEALPLYYDSENGGENLIAECSDIRYFPRERQLNYLIVSAIPLETEGNVVNEVFIGSSENIYSSRDNLYIAATNYDESDYYFDSDNARTIVYRFALTPGQIKYGGRGKVPGTILNQFSMDENGDYFRIATTQGWGDESTNNLTILDNRTMSITGKLNNLAPGERIYSTRFIGDRGYMVTFEQIDPLFVFDLSDPANPRVLGELKIPGFSNYLHPYNENHLIGFGRDVVQITRTDVWDDRTFTFAQQEGFKMALFDVTDPSQPKQMFTEVIGGSGTYSELLYDHKALLFDREKDLLAFPIQVYNWDEVVPLNGIASPEDAEAIQADEFTGAYVYTVTLENGFQLRGKVAHPATHETYEYTTTRCETNPITDEENCNEETFTEEYTYSDAIRRLLYIGDILYSVGEKWLRASDINTTEQKGLVEMK